MDELTIMAKPSKLPATSMGISTLARPDLKEGQKETHRGPRVLDEHLHILELASQPPAFSPFSPPHPLLAGFSATVQRSSTVQTLAEGGEDGFGGPRWLVFDPRPGFRDRWWSRRISLMVWWARTSLRSGVSWSPSWSRGRRRGAWQLHPRF
jgi:hypothetical protein